MQGKGPSLIANCTPRNPRLRNLTRKLFQLVFIVNQLRQADEIQNSISPGFLVRNCAGGPIGHYDDLGR